MENTRPTKEFKSEVSGMMHEYMVIDQLPSGFRSYNTDKVYVRGLYFSESTSLSKYIGNSVGKGNSDPRPLINIFKDVIRGIEIEELEPSDFYVLMIISSIWTISGFGWTPNNRCTKLVKSTEDDSEVVCGGSLSSKIVLDDLDFIDPAITESNIPVMINNAEYLCSPLTIGRKVQSLNYSESHPEEDSIYSQYASLIKKVDADLSHEELIKVIKFSAREEVLQISQLDSEFRIKIHPIIKKCANCGGEIKIALNLEDMRSYP